MSQFTIRPSNSEKEAFRIKITAASLLSLKLKSGDLCTLHLSTDDGDHPITRIAIAWENSGSGMKDNIVQTSKTLQDLYNLKLGDRITIRKSTEKLNDAATVRLRPLDFAVSNDDVRTWSFIVAAVVPLKHDILVPSQRLLVEVGTVKHDFEVVDVEGSIARITDSTIFTFAASTQYRDLLSPELDFAGVGGLHDQIQQVKKFVNCLLEVRMETAWPAYQPNQGLLLYGAKGTGKTLLQTCLARSEWLQVIWWTPGCRISKEPQLVLVSLDGKTDTTKNVDELCTLFETVKGTHSIVVGSVRHPNDIPERLRSKATFSVEIELPIPNAEQRLDILKALRGESIQPNDEQIQDIAARTHGFVGSDLNLLLHAIWNACITRDREQHAEQNGVVDVRDAPPLLLNQVDIELALSTTRPSALQEIFLEKPNVHWSDIGGQHELKRQLQTTIERPLKYPERMKRLGLQPKKGVLLYGPPGCSKTLTVKALATEAGLNFIAVKGAELISMYVGESEKATREVFRKARQASPSIIFFDEIDAIASRGRSGSDLNVLTTLLNEMDGFEELKGVLVVAATNKPQSIDPALMRPGRFDNVVYIGPPDYETRKEIFDKRFAGIDVEDAVRTSTADFAQGTDGFSGAEIVAICQNAGESAMDADRDVITLGDVYAAITRTSRSITPSILKEYEEWNAARIR